MAFFGVLCWRGLSSWPHATGVRATMANDGTLEQIVADLVPQLSTQGVENPVSFAAIERTRRTPSALVVADSGRLD
jgi:hypothetical protein